MNDDSGSSLLKEQVDLADVRLGKVATLRTAISSGEYHVSAEALADKLIDALTW